jgi:hypothetical protein
VTDIQTNGYKYVLVAKARANMPASSDSMHNTENASHNNNNNNNNNNKPRNMRCRTENEILEMIS